MITIMNTDRARTILSVDENNTTLLIGKDLDSSKLGPFLDVIDGVLTGIPKTTRPFYGHFEFTKEGMKFTLSREREGPQPHDLTYNHRL